MTTIVPTPAFGSYRLGEALTEEAIPAVVHRPLPNEAAREEMLLQKLGSRGWGRIHHFRYYYSPGWGEGTGKVLSPRASEAFYRFLEAVMFPESSTPSIFLTDNGGLELCWEDTDGHARQVEFTSKGIEYYDEARQREGFVSHRDILSLAQQFSSR